MYSVYLLLFFFTKFSLNNFQVIDEDYANYSTEVYEKLVGNLNSNCTKSDDCNIKRSFCDTTLNTCECDSTTMQIQNKCKTVLCESNVECEQKYQYSSCSSGRCLCISRKKIRGNCFKNFESATYLSEWAIVLISLSIALSALLGGTVKKKSVRRQFQSIFVLFMRLLSLYNQNERKSVCDLSVCEDNNDDNKEETDDKQENHDKEENESESKL